MTGIIILAAGQSGRMGTPKQQLQFKGASLLQHAITTAACADAEIVLVVLGFQAGALWPQAASPKVSVVLNENWQEGMASSIRTGLENLITQKPQVQNVIIMLCDQPFVTTQLLNGLIQKKAAGNNGIIACSYAGTVGVPALFSRHNFEYLTALKGEKGAKKILQQFSADVATIDFNGGAIDIDTPADFEKLSAGTIN